jgi:hypothetical protein
MTTPRSNTPELHAPAPPLVPPPRPRRWLRLLLAAVIFLSGIAVGVGVSLIVVRNRLVFAIHHPDEMPAVIAARLRRPLKLSDEQVQEVQRILSERQRALQELRRRVQPRVEAELDEVERQIAQVLDDQQQERWQRLSQHLRGTWLPDLPPPESPGPKPE